MIHKNEQPLEGAAAAEIGTSGPLAGQAPERGPSPALAAETLFEDILDVEGAVRLAMNSDAGLRTERVEEVAEGLTTLEDRLAPEAAAQLHSALEALREAVAIRDIPQVRVQQAAIVEALVTARESLA
ncbi:hypothetical protein [Novosphingobium soli]|uniref:Flagellar assembly protein FliX n=1 Tax=Novosphingobium soli TaxID=574956 RepID=A0ABV6CUZ0_9SPHN